MTALIKEVCAVCARSIGIGQIIVQCVECDCVMHHKCYKKCDLTNDCDEFYCKNCIHLAVARYNPFKIDSDTETEDNTDELLIKICNILSNCQSHPTTSLNSLLCNQPDEHSAMLFQNIDGNKSNFDSLAIEICRFKTKFSIIALAETNEDPDTSNLYQLTGYNSFYQQTAPGKSKGTGVALYVDDQISANILTNHSYVTNNLETLFISISNGNTPVTVGVVYRPPSGDIDEALNELTELLNELPKNTFIMGDFNINILEQNSSIVQQYEEILFGKEYFPLISIPTHEKPGCKSSFLLGN